jgi:hypothetical protein
MNDETDHGDEDAGIGDVKGGPGVGERDVQIEQGEVDDVTVEKTIGEVAHDSRQQ